ncbi:hypothetical protein K1Y80_46495 [Streptomyces sp. MAG02]|nr:hypothetical protein [Streptomyces sp. MAG02]
MAQLLLPGTEKYAPRASHSHIASVNPLIIVGFIRLQLSAGMSTGSDGRSTHEKRSPKEIVIYYAGRD